MKIKQIVLTFVLMLMGFTGLIAASPATQNTPYTNSEFSATFNGPVTLDPRTQEKSTEIIYQSEVDNVYQAVVVRHVNYDLEVSPANADFYADNDSMPAGDVPSDRSSGVYQGHYYTYLGHTFVIDGTTYTKRVRNIVVNAREVIFIEQITPQNLNDQQAWADFETSLNIK